jgi:hypothetical protein
VTADFDLDAIKADESETPAAPELPAVGVKRPKRLEVVYVHPSWRLEVWILPPLDQRNDPTYLVMPSVAKLPQHKNTICRRALIVPYADGEGRLFLWPILLEDHTGSINKYSRSAMGRVEEGAGQWCFYQADQVGQGYKRIVAEVQRDAPEWPAEGFQYMVRSAFEDRLIGAADHEALRRLRGKGA